MESAFVSRHFSCFDCQSRILHFTIWLLFLMVSFLECGSKCRVNYAEIRIALVTWLLICVFLHIFHPYWQKLHKGVVDYSTDRPLTPCRLTINLVSTFCSKFQLFALKTFKLSSLFGINWRALSQWACWKFCMYIIKLQTNYVLRDMGLLRLIVTGIKKNF